MSSLTYTQTWATTFLILTSIVFVIYGEVVNENLVNSVSKNAASGANLLSIGNDAHSDVARNRHHVRFGNGHDSSKKQHRNHGRNRNQRKKKRERRKKIKQERKLQRTKALLNAHRTTTLTSADLNLKWNADRNTWESLDEQHEPQRQFATGPSMSHVSVGQNTNRIYLDAPLRESSNSRPTSQTTRQEETRKYGSSPSIRFETYREDTNPYNSPPKRAEVHSEQPMPYINENSNRDAHHNNPPRVEPILLATDRANSFRSGTSSIRTNYENPNHHRRSGSRHPKHQNRGPVIRSQYWTRRYNIKLPQNYGSVSVSENSFGSPDNSSGDLINPFDRINANSHTIADETTVPTPVVIRNNSRGFSSKIGTNHFSLSLNSTLSTPHYFRVLDTMNRPITPFNWRRPHRQRNGRVQNTTRSNISDLSQSTQFEEDSADSHTSYQTNLSNSTQTYSENSHQGPSTPQNTSTSKDLSSRNARSFDFRPPSSLNRFSSARRSSSSPRGRGSVRRRHRLSSGVRGSNHTLGGSGGHEGFDIPSVAEQPARRPNIVVLLTDDLDVELGKL